MTKVPQVIHNAPQAKRDQHQDLLQGYRKINGTLEDKPGLIPS